MAVEPSVNIQGEQQRRNKTPEGGWPAVTSVAGGTFLLVTTEFLPIGLLSLISRGLDVSEGLAGLSVTTPGLVAAFAAPAVTLLARDFDRRVVLLLLTASIVASNLISAVAPNFAVFLLGRVLLGVGVGGLWSFAVAIGRRLVSEHSGARATSIISAGIGLGTVVGVPAGAVIGDVAGWRVAFVANAGFGALVLLAQLALLPRLSPTAAMNLGRLLAIAKVPMARAGLVATVFIAAGHFAGYTFLELYLRDTPRLSQDMVAGALVGYAMAGIVGAFAGELAASRGIRRAFASVTALVGASVLAAAAFGTQPSLAFAFVMVWGFAFGAVPVCNQIWMYQSAPALYEGGAALLVSVFQIALAAGAAVGGFVTDLAGVRTAFVVSGLLSLGCAALILLFRCAEPHTQRRIVEDAQ